MNGPNIGRCSANKNVFYVGCALYSRQKAFAREAVPYIAAERRLSKKVCYGGCALYSSRKAFAMEAAPYIAAERRLPSTRSHQETRTRSQSVRVS